MRLLPKGIFKTGDEELRALIEELSKEVSYSLNGLLEEYERRARRRFVWAQIGFSFLMAVLAAASIVINVA